MIRPYKGLITAVLLFISMNILAAPMEVKRFGIFVGANDGGKERIRLLYAADDAGKMARTMMDIGGIAESDSILLINPAAHEILFELKTISERISRVENFARRTEVMFYYSGHSDEQGLLVKEEQILYKEIREQLDKSGADVVIAVLDSCSSGAITRLKGGQRRSPFLIDDSSSMEGHAFLTSSSEDELSQESDSIEASFFTHYLISGLRGAADSTGDGRVTLNEIYQHTFDETLSQTESTIGGPQHPAYDIQLSGTGDLVLTDLTVPTSALKLSGELEGRFSIRNNRKLVAEFSKPRGDILKLALPSGEYSVKFSDYRESREEIMTARVSLGRNTQLYLTAGDFEPEKTEITRYRGDEEEERKQGKFVFTPVPGVNIKELSPDDKVILQGGLIGAIAPEVEGLQVSTIFNISENRTRGVQAAGIFNRTGMPSAGLQAAGIFNTAKEMVGVQGAGIFNNASYMKGLQASLVNITDNMEGVQIGLVNISREIHGLPIGLINISRNGLVDFGAWYEFSDIHRTYISFQSGTRYLYTLFYWGNAANGFFSTADHMAWGMHIGSRIPFGFLELDIDGGLKQGYRDLKTYGYGEFSAIPSFRAVAALKGLGIYGGLTMDFTYDGHVDSSLNEGKFWDFGSNGKVKAYYKYIVGIRI